jgi:hypothetical protein
MLARFFGQTAPKKRVRFLAGSRPNRVSKITCYLPKWAGPGCLDSVHNGPVVTSTPPTTRKKKHRLRAKGTESSCYPQAIFDTRNRDQIGLKIGLNILLKFFLPILYSYPAPKTCTEIPPRRVMNHPSFLSRTLSRISDSDLEPDLRSNRVFKNRFPGQNGRGSAYSTEPCGSS